MNDREAHERGSALIVDTLAMHRRAIDRGDTERAPQLSREETVAVAAYLRSIPGADFDFDAIVYDPRLSGLLASVYKLGYLRCMDDLHTERIAL